jgi:hypothetical protein
MLTKLPFSISPSFLRLSTNERAKLSLKFLPLAAMPYSRTLDIFYANKHVAIPVSGSGGFARLVCEQYQDRLVDIGNHMEGVTSWINLTITNKGTVPLNLIEVYSPQNTRCRLKFLNITHSGSVSMIQASKLEISESVDYWMIVKKRLRRVILGMVVLSPSLTQSKQKKFLRLDGLMDIPIVSSKLTDSNNADLNLPQLLPNHSYNFKLGLKSIYGRSELNSVTFIYRAVIGSANRKNVGNTQELSISFSGKTFRPLEFNPCGYNFGIVPIIESGLTSAIRRAEMSSFEELGISQTQKEGRPDLLHLKVTNFSRDAQQLLLESILKGNTYNIIVHLIFVGARKE